MLFFILCVSSTQDNLLNCKWELPVDPVVSTLSLQLRDMSSTPGEGTKIPQIMQCGQKKKKKFKDQNKKNKTLLLKKKIKKINASNCKCHPTKNKAKYFILNFKVSLASFAILTTNVHFDEHGIPYMFTTD